MGLFEDLITQILKGPTDDKGCDWFCDCCNTLMNNQPGFSTSSGSWICSECNHFNDVSSDNIRHYGVRPVTDDQLRYIKKIEELLDVTFYGTTLEEASEFIDDHRDRYSAKLHTPHKYR